MSVSAEGVAAGDAFEGEPAAFECAVFFDCLDSVLRTGRDIAAARRYQRADGVLVKTDQREDEFGQQGIHQRLRISCANWFRASAAFCRLNARRTRTTKSCGGRLFLFSLNQSRMTRFM